MSTYGFPMNDVLPLIEETIETSTPRVRVWSLVGDLTNMSRWSPQVMHTRVSDRPIGLGTTMLNINRRGLLVWPTRGKVVRFEPHREIAFRIKDNYTIWSFTLEDTESGGTRITQRREAPDGISKLSDTLTTRVLGGVGPFQEELREGMQQTLRRIKAEAEA